MIIQATNNHYENLNNKFLLDPKETVICFDNIYRIQCILPINQSLEQS